MQTQWAELRGQLAASSSGYTHVSVTVKPVNLTLHRYRVFNSIGSQEGRGAGNARTDSRLCRSTWVAVEMTHLPIERQARVIGAAWLDQQLIGAGKELS